MEKFYDLEFQERSIFLSALLATIVTANSQQAPDPRVQDLVRAGKLRAALFLPQFTKNTVTGEIRGDVHLVETARALATRLGVELMLVDYPTPTKALEGRSAHAMWRFWESTHPGPEAAHEGWGGWSIRLAPLFRLAIWRCCPAFPPEIPRRNAP